MKQLRITLLLVFVGLLTSLSDCRQPEPNPKTELEKLPPATQQGRYTFGCLVNGKAMVPSNTIDVAATYQFNWLQINGYAEIDGSRQSVNFFIDDANIIERSYQLDSSLTRNGRYSYSNDKIRCDHSTDGSTDNTGVLTITKFDRVNLIVSGTFSLTVSPPDCPKYVITDGRFDLKFIP